MSSSTYALSSAPTDLSWNDIALSSTGQYIFASAGDSYVFASTDYGSTWTNHSTGFDVPSSAFVVCSSTGQRVSSLGGDAYVYSSNDYGMTWTQSDDYYPDTADIASDSTGQFLVLVGSSSVYRSADYGLTFSELDLASIISFCRSVASSSTGQYLTAVCKNSQNSWVVIMSQNSGATFTVVTSLTNYEFKVVAMNPSGQVQLVGSDFLAGVWISKDYGVTWTGTTASSLLSYEGIATFGSGSDIVLASMASIQKTTNYGSDWAQYSTYPLLPNAVGLSSNGKVMAAVGSSQGIYITTNMFSSDGGSSSSSSGGGSSELSPGAAAGVSIAVIAVVLAVAAFVLFKMGYCAAKSTEASKDVPMGNKSAV